MQWPKLEAALGYMEKMTDSMGMVEHAKYHFAKKSEGYTTDDNARAYQVMIRLGRPGGVYLKFLEKAYESGGFHNDMNFNGRWIDKPGYGEWFGRAVSALGEGRIRGVSEDKIICRTLFQGALEKILQVNSIRCKAHIISGLSWSEEGSDSVRNLSEELVKNFIDNSNGYWKWFEQGLYYDNGKLPQALFEAYKVTNNDRFLNVARESLDFLIDKSYDSDRNFFMFPGTNGWWKRNKSWELFDEQPVDAGSIVEACVTAHQVTKDKKYLDWANTAWGWYEGRNLLGLSMVDEETGGVRDGLHEDRVNLNEGAEAVLSYLLAGMAIKELQ